MLFTDGYTNQALHDLGGNVDGETARHRNRRTRSGPIPLPWPVRTGRTLATPP